MYSIGEMVVTVENQGTRRKEFPSVILSIKISTWLGVGSNPVFHGNKSATERLRHGTALEKVNVLGGLTRACYGINFMILSIKDVNLNSFAVAHLECTQKTKYLIETGTGNAHFFMCIGPCIILTTEE